MGPTLPALLASSDLCTQVSTSTGASPPGSTTCIHQHPSSIYRHTLSCTTSGDTFRYLSLQAPMKLLCRTEGAELGQRDCCHSPFP